MEQWRVNLKETSYKQQTNVMTVFILILYMQAYLFLYFTQPFVHYFYQTL